MNNGRLLTWEFNLCGFDRETDPQAVRSVEYLEEHGMSFNTHHLYDIPMATSRSITAAYFGSQGYRGSPTLAPTTWPT